MFNRVLAIDWSGEGEEHDGVGLGVASFDVQTAQGVITPLPGKIKEFRKRSRTACRRLLAEELSKNKLKEGMPSLVAMDFGFGLPWGSDGALFGVQGWENLVRRLAQMYSLCGTARRVGRAVNRFRRFHKHGPYRFDNHKSFLIDTQRSDFRFYLDYGVPYYRLTELAVPQASSQWNLCSNIGAVGFHSITAIATLDHLLQLRKSGEIAFEIWPHEVWIPDGSVNVLAECYPAICPIPKQAPKGITEHEEDAWRVGSFLLERLRGNDPLKLFDIVERPFGRIKDIGFKKQVEFEGFMIGLQ